MPSDSFRDIGERVDAQLAELRERQQRQAKAKAEADKEAVERKAREALSAEIRRLDVEHRNLVTAIENLDQRIRVASPRSRDEIAEHEAKLYKLKSMLIERSALASQLSRKRAELRRLQ